MKRKVKQEKIKLNYKQAEGLSEADIQQNLDDAFDILFNEVVKNHGSEKTI